MKQTKHSAANKMTISCTISSGRCIFPFQTDKVIKESLRMFDTQKKRINENFDINAEKNKS